MAPGDSQATPRPDTASAYEDVAARCKSPAASSRPTTSSIWPASDSWSSATRSNGSLPSPR